MSDAVDQIDKLICEGWYATMMHSTDCPPKKLQSEFYHQ